MVPVLVQGETLHLLPDRAVAWPARRTLLVADLHLGKSSSFGAAGIPVPDTTPRTLGRLGELLRATGAERLVVLGDLMHARSGRTEETLRAFATWRRSHAGLSILLIRGNHDVSAGDPPSEWMIDSVEAPKREDPFALCHTPQECDPAAASRRSDPPLYGLCGHLHPVHVLHDGGVSSVRASCLWMTPTHAVLPAFGDFTGGQRIRPRHGDRVFLYGESEVVEVPCG